MITPVENKITEKTEINLLTLWHFYQPPGQRDEIVYEVTNQCYRPVTNWLANNNFHVAVNITRSLMEHLIKLHLHDVIENLGIATENGSIELTASAGYHAILPKLRDYEGGESEVKRQIELNEEFNRKIFGSLWNPKGFFPPEMAFSPELALIIKEMGYEWTITDAPLFDAVHDYKISIPYRNIGTVNGLPVFFRSNWSNEFALEMPKRHDYNITAYIARMRQDISKWFNDHIAHLTLGYDVETLGHHVKEYNLSALDTYVKVCFENGIKPTLFSQILPQYEKKEVKILPGSWSSSVEDIKAGEYYPSWYHSKNPVHRVFEQLEQHAIATVHKAAELVSSNPIAKQLYEKARKELDEGLHSCKQWWSNPLHGRWNTRHIYHGFNLLEGAISNAIDAILLSEVIGELNTDGFRGTPDQLKSSVKDLEIRLRELAPLHH